MEALTHADPNKITVQGVELPSRAFSTASLRADILDKAKDCVCGHREQDYGSPENPDWNYSAPHGAGRLMSRRQAKEMLPLEDYETAMDGIFSTSVSYATIDEAPQVYKPMSEIIDCISETVRIKKILKPIYNFKAGD